MPRRTARTDRLLRVALVFPVPLLLAGPASAAPAEDFAIGDLGHVIAAWVIFLLLLVVLGKWGWRPIVSQLRRREESIAQTIEQNEQREKHSQELLALYKARLDQVEGEVAQMLAQGKKQADEARDEILQSARRQSRELMDSTRREIEQAKHETMEELRQTTAELATDIAARVLRKSLDEQEHQRLMAQSLQEIEAQAGDGHHD